MIHRRAGAGPRREPYALSMDSDGPATPTLAAVRRARAHREMVLRRMMPLGLLAVVVVLVSAFRNHPGPGLHGGSLGVLLAVLGIAVGVLGTLGRRRRGAAQGPPLTRVPASREIQALQIAALSVFMLGSATLAWLQPKGPASSGSSSRWPWRSA